MMLRHVPAAPLNAAIACLWASEREALPHGRERNLPSGRADLVIALRQEHLGRFDSPTDASGERFCGALIQGPQERCFFRDTSQASSVVGVQFQPAGAAALLGLPMSELANRRLALDDLLGRQAFEVRERLQALPSAKERLRCLEAFLLQRLLRATPHEDDAPIAWAVQQFHTRDARVETVRHELGWSAQRFIAQFLRRVGLAPKRYGRVRRFQSVIDRLARGRDAGWAQIALDAGYADQAHLIREFRAFSGLTPTEYRAVAPDQANHVAVAEKIFNTRARHRR